MDYLDELRARLIIPESYADAYSYFEDLHLLFNMIVNGNGGGNYDNQINELNNRMTTLENRVTIQGLRINNVRTELINLTNDVADLGNSLVSMNQQIGVLNNSKQDKLTPGNGIEINGNVISATGGGGNSVSNIAWLPNVNENGWVSWQRSMSENAPDPVNITGPAGQNGVNGQNGNDGFSPIVNITPITDGHQIDITDANGTQTFNVLDGANGVNGINGVNGVNGVNGNDGFSPVVTVTAIEGGNQINITDANGTQSFNVMDGRNGRNGTNGTNGNSPIIEMIPRNDNSGYNMIVHEANGWESLYFIANGANGANGFSPVVEVTPITNGHQVNITDANGTQSFNVMDGNRGPRGYQGEQGMQGDPGEPGNSPTIEVTDLMSGYSVDIYQANGYLNSFFISNGAQGPQGPQGPQGKDGSSFAFSWYQMPGNTVGTYNFKCNNAHVNVAAYNNGLFTVLTTDNTACNLLKDLKCIDIEATWMFVGFQTPKPLMNTHTTLFINNFYGNQNLFAPSFQGIARMKVNDELKPVYFYSSSLNVQLNLINRTADRIDFNMTTPFSITWGNLNLSGSSIYSALTASLQHVDVKLF